MEYEKGEWNSVDVTGFSEKQLDLDTEILAGDLQRLRKNKSFQKRSRKDKIIASYQTVSNRLNQLIGMYYSFMDMNPHEATKMLLELRKLHLVQEILLNCLVWEPAGELKKDMVPKDVWDLIE